MHSRRHPFKWHLDIDYYLNPVLPPSPLPRLPPWATRLLGYRSSPLPPLGNIVITFWAFIGAFCGVSLVQVLGQRVPLFVEQGAPLIVGSFGAAAVLEFYAIESPLGQPRNAIIGQLLSATVGVGTYKVFSLAANFDEIRWVGSALACASATAVMALTGTVHPPAGATAMMAVADDNVARLGWYLIPLVLFGCSLMLTTALLVNNVQRRFPIYWWTPEAVGQRWNPNRGLEKTPHVVVAGSDVGSKQELSPGDLAYRVESGEEAKLVITKGEVILPYAMFLRPDEKLLLETLSQRL